MKSPTAGETPDRIGTRRAPATRLLAVSFAATLAGLAGAACINSTIPLAPECTPAITVELSRPEVHVGDEFTATAMHRGDECLSNLMWRGEGPITLRVAEGHSATFRADASGLGTIRVQNDKGSLGVAEVEVQESEEERNRAHMSY